MAHRSVSAQEHMPFLLRLREPPLSEMIIFWRYSGNLYRPRMPHDDGCVWCLHNKRRDDILNVDTRDGAIRFAPCAFVDYTIKLSAAEWGDDDDDTPMSTGKTEKKRACNERVGYGAEEFVAVRLG